MVWITVSSKPRGWLLAFPLLVLPMVLVIYSPLVIGILVIPGLRL